MNVKIYPEIIKYSINFNLKIKAYDDDNNDININSNIKEALINNIREKSKNNFVLNNLGNIKLNNYSINNIDNKLYFLLDISTEKDYLDIKDVENIILNIFPFAYSTDDKFIIHYDFFTKIKTCIIYAPNTPQNIKYN
jgi:hypothetical protein